jgi:hypothetical protein
MSIDPEVLLQTADEELTKRFPKETFGLTRGELRAMKRKAKGLGETLSQRVAQDRGLRKIKESHGDLKKKYDQLIESYDDLEAQFNAVVNLKNTIDTFTIAPQKRGRGSEATAVLVASDWHTDERIDPATINGLNEFNPTIAERRVKNFFRSGLRLVDILAQDVEIKTIVLALLGDFYTGHIHPDFMELTDTQPIHAVIRVQNMIASGIQFILDNSKYNLVIPCHSGNHARTTDKTRFATENGHSLEYYMYHFLADHFKDEPRVKFIIPDGYHSYMDIYGVTVRFHHGHAMRYGGGIGGIYIPTNKAIAQWNRSKRADIDVFGHFHQQRDGGNFIANGSLIGYSAFALSIKADFEKPKQTLFLIDSKRGKTAVWPIMLDD